MKNGPSFDTIINNLTYAKDFMDIVIRVNVDRENIEQVEPFLDYLKTNDFIGKVAVDIGRVSDCNQDMSARYGNLLLESKEYFEKRNSLEREFKRYVSYHCLQI